MAAFLIRKVEKRQCRKVRMDMEIMKVNSDILGGEIQIPRLHFPRISVPAHLGIVEGPHRILLPIDRAQQVWQSQGRIDPIGRFAPLRSDLRRSAAAGRCRRRLALG